NAEAKRAMSTGVKFSPALPPMVPRIPEMDLMSVMFFEQTNIEVCQLAPVVYFAPMKWRIWLLPFSLLYGVVIIFRNVLYDLNVLKSQRFNVPVISVGNLTVGGSGKTPMTEHIIRLLSS